MDEPIFFLHWTLRTHKSFEVGEELRDNLDIIMGKMNRKKHGFIPQILQFRKMN